jgi:hypothetical protein
MGEAEARGDLAGVKVEPGQIAGLARRCAMMRAEEDEPDPIPAVEAVEPGPGAVSGRRLPRPRE